MTMADDFGDIDISQFGAGSLSGAGVDDHYSTKSNPHQGGVKFMISCDTCGQRQYVDVSWDEIIIVSQSQKPPGTPASPPWDYSARHGALHPNLPCCQCGRRDTLVMLTPDEAQRHLRAGIQAGYVQPQYVNAALQQIRQRLGQYGG